MGEVVDIHAGPGRRGAEANAELIRRHFSLSPAAQEYWQMEADPTRMDPTRVRSLRAVLGRERKYMPASIRAALALVISQLDEEIRASPLCVECQLERAVGGGRCFKCRAESTL